MLIVYLCCAALVLGAMVQGDEFECEREAFYIENNCNRCQCGGNGYLLCGFKKCLVKTRLSLYKCEPGARYHQGCNECWCVEGFGTICTLRNCF
ncbi:protease inhibitors-like [Photinus pyralis]|uniref:protease inhibitors-like n=1 Tax=Photinus pyralis TaxID=7054 RepID=UPI0012676F79|nr:protease inhibitors-like [Photinus pyralis]XP_031357384.1 protease inhibitors-like [Photinus pyralis]